MAYLLCEWLQISHEAHSIGKSTMNCGVCVKGTGYGEYENDFYGSSN